MSQQANHSDLPPFDAGSGSRRDAAQADGVSGELFRILVVDPSEGVRQSLPANLGAGAATELDHVSTAGQARQCLAEKRIDLAILACELPDGSGLELAGEFRQELGGARSILVSDEPTTEQAIQAIRAGACDFFQRPVDPAQLQRRIEQVIAETQQDRMQARRLSRLRRTCRKLNKARQEISQQVDVLCNDLVNAYQELAEQMQQTMSSQALAERIRDELDLEQVLRLSMEYLIELGGAANAAVFLPANMSDFTVGGYINHDGSLDGEGLVLEHLADVLAPPLADGEHTVIHLQSEGDRRAWLGEAVPALRNVEMVGLACRQDDETLAVIVLFRDRAEPFPASFADQCKGVADELGESLLKLIRIHNRHML